MLPENYVQVFPVLNVAVRPSTFVLWYTFSGSPTPSSNVDSLAFVISFALSTPLLNIMSQDYDYYGVNVRSNVAGVVKDGAYATSAAGAQLTAGLPSRLSAVIRKVTATGGRTGRGRWFVPGLAEGMIQDSEFTSSALTQLGTLGAFLTGPITTTSDWGTLTPVLYDRKHSIFIELVTYDVSAYPVSLRRRAPRFPVP